MAIVQGVLDPEKSHPAMKTHLVSHILGTIAGGFGYLFIPGFLARHDRAPCAAFDVAKNMFLGSLTIMGVAIMGVVVGNAGR